MPAGRPCAAGTLPSAPDASFRAEVLCERVVAREGSVCGWNLTPSWDSQLLPEHVAVSLRGPRRNPESRADLVVRTARCDQCDDLELSVRQGDLLVIEDWRHAATGRRWG